MRVCFISIGHCSDSPRAPREIYSLSKYYDVKVIEFDKTGRLPAKDSLGGAKVTRVRPKKWSSINALNFLSVLSVLPPEVLRSKADIYHCYGFLELIVGVLVRIPTGKKLIYDAYELYPYQFSPKENKTAASRAKKFLIWNIVYAFENLLIRFADRVLTVPSFNDELLRRFQRHHKHVTVIWNVPNPDLFNRRTTKIEQKHNNHTNVLYVGGINRSRGITKLLEAISIVKKEVNDIKVTLVGTNMMSNLSQYLKELNIQENVKLTGSLPPYTLSGYLKTTDIGVVLYEPTYWTLRSKASEKIFIYMLFSIPVISSDFPGLREIVNENNCGITVNPADAREIANAIMYLLKNPVEARKLGENGKKAVEKKYDWKFEEKKLIEIYKGILIDEKT